MTRKNDTLVYKLVPIIFTDEVNQRVITNIDVPHIVVGITNVLYLKDNYQLPIYIDPNDPKQPPFITDLYINGIYGGNDWHYQHEWQIRAMLHTASNIQDITLLVQNRIVPLKGSITDCMAIVAYYDKSKRFQ